MYETPEYRDYALGEMTLRYLYDPESGHIAMTLIPQGTETYYHERRKYLRHRDLICNAWETGSLCHLALRHHAQGNGAGNTLKYGESTERLKYTEQKLSENEEEIRILTRLKTDEGYEVLHTVTYVRGEKGLSIETQFRNLTDKKAVLDMLTSFSLDNLSPFQRDDAPYKLKLHRFRGGWSLEGKHCVDTVEELNLESSWFRGFPESERYGGLGSHPVKRWFPFGCVEDTEYHTYWAAQIEAGSSWQMEFSRDGDCYSLSGGLADCEYGGWWKEILPGETFTAPRAYVSVSRVSLWDVCQNITDMFHKYADIQPECEKDLPILFNEWCTSWGSPTHDSMLAIAEKIKEIPVSYAVIDAGWSRKEKDDHDPQGSNGEWDCDTEKFPAGLRGLSRELKALGLRTGIWMEFEVTTKRSDVHEGAWDQMHLYRNGEVIQTGKIRRFWDFRKPEVTAYLTEKVIGFLRKNEIGYLKVDYNGSIGYGCDGAESPGEGLRVQMEAVREFFRKIRGELTDLVIENCASGGHRLEPSMLKLTAMSSFSDAHECDEIPYIAADLHCLILPRQSQVWAVISPELSIREIRYRLASAMLGRFCLSGEITKLSDGQWDEVKNAAAFYEHVKRIIKDGRSVLFRESTDNHHHLRGIQALLRNRNDEEILLVCHAFAEPPEKLCGAVPEGRWKIKECIGEEGRLAVREDGFEIRPQGEWEAFAAHLVRV